MADGQAAAMAVPFPQPPPYVEHFTESNILRLREIQKADGETTLPDDLQYLVPPAPPQGGKYRSFGIQHDLNQPDLSLSAAGITQLYPSTQESTDPTPKLIALSRAIILNFLELVGIMSNNPEEATEKVEELQTLFYNAHDLINQYRPHQARESLILMMEEQVRRAREEIAAVRESRAKLKELLGSVRTAGEAAAGGARSGEGKQLTEVKEAKRADDALSATALKKRTLQQRQWDALHAEFG